MVKCIKFLADNVQRKYKKYFKIFTYQCEMLTIHYTGKGTFNTKMATFNKRQMQQTGVVILK